MPFASPAAQRAANHRSGKKRRSTPEGRRQEKSWKLKHRYGITINQYDEMLKRQAGTCAICHDPDALLHVDHDHITGAVRGLLCFACNSALGKFRDDPARLLSALDYLEAARCTPSDQSSLEAQT